MPSSKSAATASNPTHLPPRFEIRQLEQKHIPWASAIVVHSNIFHSPIWPLVYPEGKTARAMRGLHSADYLVRHQIESGLSFGVFDMEYKFKNPDSEATEGKLYWDTADEDASSEKLLEQMDFPLCSVALAYDGVKPLELEKLGPMMAVLPLFGTVYHVLEAGDPREKDSWIAKGPHEVLMRNATSTRAEYEGHGIMKKLAQFLMRHAAELGFRAIQIETAHDAVTHTWRNPPKPFRAEVIATFDTASYYEDGEDGKKFRPFGDAKQVLAKIFVTLKPDENGQPINGAPVAALG